MNLPDPRMIPVPVLAKPCGCSFLLYDGKKEQVAWCPKHFKKDEEMIEFTCDRCKKAVYQLYEITLHSAPIVIGESHDGGVHPNYAQLCEVCLSEKDSQFKKWIMKLEVQE